MIDFQKLWHPLPQTPALNSHVGLQPLSLSWTELYRVLTALAKRIMAQGVEPGSTVLIHAASGQSELYTFLLLNSLSLIGCRVILPMNPLREETAIWSRKLQWQHTFAPLQLELYHCDRFQASEEHTIEASQLLGSDLVSFIEEALKNTSEPIALPDIQNSSGEELFISTSGSSGKPKFLSYGWSCFIRSAQSWEKAGLFDESQMGGAGLTLLLAHTMGIRTWINALYNKNPFCLMDADLFQSEPTVAAYLLGEMKPKHITGGPALYGMLLELSRYVPQLNEELRNSLTTVVMSGAPWAPKVAERIKSAWGVQPINAFGTTETLQVMRQSAAAAGTAALGEPLPDVALHLQELETGEFQLGFSTPFSARRCYYIDGDSQPLESPFFTGDIVRRTADGTLEFLSRTQKDFFKDAFGVKIQLQLLMKQLPTWEGGTLLFEGMVDRPGLLLTIVQDSTQSQEQPKNLLSQWATHAYRLNQNITADIDSKEAQHYQIFRVALIEHPIPTTRKGGINEFQLRLELRDFLSSATLSYFQSSHIEDLEEPTDQQQLLSMLNPRYATLLRLLRLNETIISGERDWVAFTQDGEKYLDCVGGFGVNLLGHNNRELKESAINHLQSEAIAIADQGSFQIEAAKLCRDLQQALLHETGKEYRIFLTNSGAESVDLALRHAYLQFQQKLNRLKQKELFKVQKNAPQMSSEFEQQWQRAVSAYKPLILNMQGSFHGNLISEANISRNEDGTNPLSEIAPFEEFSISSTADLECFHKHTEMQLPTLKRVDGEWSIATKELNRHMATIVEPVRGEGGVLVQEQELLEQLSSLDAPLIADSIQCGLGRCGSLIGAQAQFDSILFGKALGGGIARIAAVAIAQESYCHDLNKYATNTYGNGALGAVIAQKALEIIEREEVSSKALAIGEEIGKMLLEFQSDFPDWVERINGTGLLWGIKFSFTNHQEDFFVRQIGETELGGYLLASWLFHRCNIRIIPTLSAHHTLRIEPSIHFGSEEIAFLKKGLYKLGQVLQKRDWHELCLPLVYEDPWKKEALSKRFETSDMTFAKEKPAQKAKRVGFVVHFLHGEAELYHIVPSFRNFSKPALQMLFHHFMQLSEFKAISLYAHNMHQGEIWMNARTLTIDVATLQGHLTSYQRDKLLKELQCAVDALANEGCRYVSLGAFTSIISENGLRLREPENCRILTGNTLTVAHSIHLLRKHLEESSTLCVVGGTGNIGTALVRRLLQNGANYKKVILFGRRARLFKEELEQLLGSDSLDNIAYTSDFDRLSEGDVIVGASSASEPLIFPHHIKAGKEVAILDLAVPSAVAPATYELPNVVSLVSHPGLEMPEDREFQMSPTLPPGVAYCCAAEAVLCGLTEDEELSTDGQLRGKIDIRMIDTMEQLADRYGYFTQAIALENYEAVSL